jgi:hypothetical protein
MRLPGIQEGTMALADFVMRLGTDTSLLRRFKSNPDAAMEGAVLSDEEKELLKEGDACRIGHAISADRPVVAGQAGPYARQWADGHPFIDLTAIGVDSSA